MAGFQSQVNAAQAPAMAGDFASANANKYSRLAGPGGVFAGPNGLFQARFAWLRASYLDGDGAPTVANNTGTGQPAGFVHRDQQALNTTFLSQASLLMPSGFPVTLFAEGDFWMQNAGQTQALPGQKAYATYADGTVTFAASGAAALSLMTSSVAASTFAVTGSINGNTLTVTAVSSGTLVNGATISGTGVATGTLIAAQLSGVAGGIGVYAVNIGEQLTASVAISGTYGTLTISAVVSGAVGVGSVVTAGTGAVVGTVITQALSGTGGDSRGTYVVNNNAVVASTTLTFATNIETKWTCMTSGLPGEIVKTTCIL